MSSYHVTISNQLNELGFLWSRDFVFFDFGQQRKTAAVLDVGAINNIAHSDGALYNFVEELPALGHSDMFGEEVLGFTITNFSSSNIHFSI